MFLPSIIAALGYKNWEAQLLTVPPYVLATILTIVYAVVSERYQIRAPFIIASSLTAIIGYCILLSNEDPTANAAKSYVGVFFAAAGIYPSVALGLSWPAMNVSGQTKRAAANGLQITVSQGRAKDKTGFEPSSQIVQSVYAPSDCWRYKLLTHSFSVFRSVTWEQSLEHNCTVLETSLGTLSATALR